MKISEKICLMLISTFTIAGCGAGPKSTPAEPGGPHFQGLLDGEPNTAGQSVASQQQLQGVQTPPDQQGGRSYGQGTRPAYGQHGAQVITTDTGLRYQELVVGQGATPAPGQTVVVQYTGWLQNGQKFDSSYDHGQPFSFPLATGQVIKGWDEGVATMRVGGKRRLLVPPELGYGAAGVQGTIPPNSTLIFDVELCNLQPMQGYRTE